MSPRSCLLESNEEICKLHFLKEEKGSFRFFCKNIVRNEAIKALDYQVIGEARRKNVNVPLQTES